MLKEQMEQKANAEAEKMKNQYAETENAMQTQMNKQRLQLQALQSQLVALKMMGPSADIAPKVRSIDVFGAEKSRSSRRVVCATADPASSRKSRKSSDVRAARQAAHALSRRSRIRDSLDRRVTHGVSSHSASEAANAFTLPEVQHISAFASSLSMVRTLDTLVSVPS
jgi:hypothetical protein